MAGTGAVSAPRQSFKSSGHPKIMNQSSSLLTRRNAAMPVAEPAILEVAAAPPSVSEGLVDQLASRIGALGVEPADVAWKEHYGAGGVSAQSERFGHLQKTAET